MGTETTPRSESGCPHTSQPSVCLSVWGAFLFDAGSFDKSRMGQMELAAACVSSRRKHCEIRDGEEHVLGLLLAECTAPDVFLSASGRVWLGMLSGAPAGD